MKKRLLLLTFSFLFSFQIFAQDVPEEQRILVTKISATWCPPCGGWGWIFFENLIEDNEDKAVYVTVHHSGQLNNATAEALANNFNPPYQPRFLLNNEDQSVTPNNSAAKRIAMQDSIDATFATAPVANSGVNLFYTDELLVQTKAKFFQETEGEYYLGVYFVESDFVNFQESIGADAVHEKVIRSALTDEPFGELLVNGPVSADTEFEFEFWMDADMGEIGFLEIMTVIWKKENDIYNVVNVNVVDETQIVLVESTDDLLTSAKMSVHPNVISNQATISIEVDSSLKNARLEVFDLFGKKVTDIFQGNLPAGNHTFSLEKSLNLKSGMYFIALQANEKVATQKIIFN